MFVWGGDGTVQRCIDAVAGTDTAVAILPANLLAADLKLPHEVAIMRVPAPHPSRRPHPSR